MAKHFHLGDSLLLLDDKEPRGFLATLIQLDETRGLVRLVPEQVRLLAAALNEWYGAGLCDACEHAKAQLGALREQLAQAQADNDLAQQEIARLTAEKPKRTRKPKEEAAGGSQVGDTVTLAGGASGVIERVFDGCNKIQIAVNGVPRVVDSTEISHLPVPMAPSAVGLEVIASDDLGDLVETLEAVGLTVVTEVPELVVADQDPEKLRLALYEDSQALGFTADEMRALITEVVGEPKSSKELTVHQLGAVLRVMHGRSIEKLPF